MFSFLKLDLRSLAILRILLGLVLIYDLFTYLPMAEFYLSDEGFVSRINFLKEQANPWNWSLLYISGNTYFVYGFLTWHLVTLLLFVLGYKTKWQTFFLWIQIISLHNRNWTVLNGGDELVRCCFLILIFLPLGAAYSWDSLDSYKKNSPHSTNSLVNLALFLQLSIMYVSSAIFKDHPIWNKEFSALHYALSLDLFVRPAGVWLKNQDTLIAPMTAFAYYFELFGPILLFIGIIKKWWNFSRYLIVIAFVSFHLFIDTILNVGTFPYFAITLWLAFLPTHFWDSLKFDRKVKKATILYLQKHKKLKHILADQWLKIKFFQKYFYNFLGLFLILNLLYWPLLDANFRFNVGQKYYPAFFQTTNRWLATYQDWHLFAPYPKVDNLWMEITGTLQNGKEVDLYRMISKDKKLTAEEVREFYSFEKWRKILLKTEISPIHQTWLSEYYCTQWKKIAGDKFDNQKLNKVTINAHHQLTKGRGIASEERKEQFKSAYLCK